MEGVLVPLTIILKNSLGKFVSAPHYFTFHWIRNPCSHWQTISSRGHCKGSTEIEIMTTAWPLGAPPFPVNY